MRPWKGLITSHTLQIIFNASVNNFCLPIHLGVIGCRELQHHALEFEKFFPKRTGENRISVTCNCIREPMKFINMIKEKLCHHLG